MTPHLKVEVFLSLWDKQVVGWISQPLIRRLYNDMENIHNILSGGKKAYYTQYVYCNPTFM